MLAAALLSAAFIGLALLAAPPDVSAQGDDVLIVCVTKSLAAQSLDTNGDGVKDNPATNYSVTLTPTGGTPVTEDFLPATNTIT